MELSNTLIDHKQKGFAMLETLLLTGILLTIVFLGFFTFVPSQKQKLQELNKEKETYDGIKFKWN